MGGVIVNFCVNLRLLISIYPYWNVALFIMYLRKQIIIYGTSYC